MKYEKLDDDDDFYVALDTKDVVVDFNTRDVRTVLYYGHGYPDHPIISFETHASVQGIFVDGKYQLTNNSSDDEILKARSESLLDIGIEAYKIKGAELKDYSIHKSSKSISIEFRVKP